MFLLWFSFMKHVGPIMEADKLSFLKGLPHNFWRNLTVSNNFSIFVLPLKQKLRMSTINIFHDIAIWKFFICRKMYISKFTFLCDVTEEVEFLAPWNKTRTLAKKNKKNMVVWVIGILNQLFIKFIVIKIKGKLKAKSYWLHCISKNNIYLIRAFQSPMHKMKRVTQVFTIS